MFNALEEKFGIQAKKDKTYREELKKLARDNNKDSKDGKKELKALLEIALDHRKFEIDNYWKRAQYFGGFMSMCFGTAWLTGFLDKLLVCGGSEDALFISTLLVFLGFLSSVGFYLVNKGSKFWQQNWEYHVDMLEEALGRKLHSRIAISNRAKLFSIFDEYPFSVSKVNLMLSIFLMAFWFVLLAYKLFQIRDANLAGSVLSIPNLIWYIFFILLVIVIFFAFKTRTTSLHQSKDKKTDDFNVYER